MSIKPRHLWRDELHESHSRRSSASERGVYAASFPNSEHPAFSIQYRVSRQSGISIAEFIIALGIAGLVLAQICLLWFYSSRSFAAQLSYSDMDQKSQRALDTFSQNVRECKMLTNFSNTRIVLIDYDDKPLMFAFDNGRLMRHKPPGPPMALLTDCQDGQFAMYQRTPISGGFDYYPTTDPNTCKLVEISWTCSRRLFPTAPTTTETMQSARVVMRVK